MTGPTNFREAEALLDNGWKDSFSTGSDFETFLRQQESRVADTLTELGLH